MTPDLFTHAPAGDPIGAATKRGATFEQRGAEWFATARKRGRPVPLVEFAAPTQGEAASMFCSYFHIKE